MKKRTPLIFVLALTLVLSACNKSARQDDLVQRLDSTSYDFTEAKPVGTRDPGAMVIDDSHHIGSAFESLSGEGGTVVDGDAVDGRTDADAVTVE